VSLLSYFTMCSDTENEKLAAAPLWLMAFESDSESRVRGFLSDPCRTSRDGRAVIHIALRASKWRGVRARPTSAEGCGGGYG